MDTSKTYWAALPAEELAPAMKRKVDFFYEHIKRTGRLDLWRRAVRTYYGLDADSGGWANSSAVTFGGEQGELVLLRVNHFRSLCQHVHTLVTGNRPALQGRAVNNDPKSIEQTIVTEQLLEWYFKRKRIEETMGRAAEWCLPWGEGWVELTWDPYRGEIFDEDPVTGAPVYTGDISAVPRRAIDVIRDPLASFEGDEDQSWYIVRVKRNRFELMAQYAEHEDKILGAEDAVEDDSNDYTSAGGEKSDHCWVYVLYHKKTLTLPQGRYALMVGDRIFEDGPLPYANIPLHPIFPSVEEDTCFGFSPMWDLLAPQQCLDAVVSTLKSNHDAFGVQNVLVPEGSNISPQDIAGGLRFIKYNKAMGEPSALQLLEPSENSYRLIDYLEKTMETISGVNSVARGNPQESLKTGPALALVQSMAVSYNSGFQWAFARLCERVGTSLLEILKMYVTTPRVAEIAGQDNRYAAQQWTGETLAAVGRVVVEIGNPLMQTVAGRKDVADTMLNQGLIRDLDQYSMVLASGRAEPVYKRDRDELRLIGAENDLMREGKPVKALVTDRHTIHIREHSTVMANPEIRFDEAIASTVLAHIQEHIQQLTMTDPIILQAIGEPVMDPNMMAAMNGTAPAANDNGGSQPGDKAAPPEKQNGLQQGLTPTQPEMPEMPEVPQLPAVGQ